MPKPLEKNIEWIAMGLGVLWLGYVVWAYVLSSPTIPIGSEKLGPSMIDEETLDREAKPLKTRMETAGDIDIKPVGLVDVFAKQMGETPPPVSVASAVSSPPQMHNLNNAGAGSPLYQKIEKFPEPVIVTDVKVISGRSLVTFQDAPSAADLKLQKEAIQQAVDGVPNNAAAAPAPAPAAAAPPAGEAPQKDRTWVTVFGSYNQTQYQKNMADAGYPNFLQDLLYCQIELQRQECLVGGGYGKIEAAGSLAMYTPPVDRLKEKPDYYYAWATGAQPTIVQPPFYTVVAGTPWEVPAKPGTAVVVDPNQPATPFEPTTLYNEFKAARDSTDPKQKPILMKAVLDKINALPPKDKQAYFLYKKKTEDEEWKAAHPPPPPPPPRTPRSGGSAPAPRSFGGRGYSGDAIDPEILRGMYASGPAFPRSVANDGTPRSAGRPIDEGGAPAGNQPQAGQPIVPDPVTGAVDVWAHDETAEPGKTYRYRIRVVLKNPVYGNNTIVANPKLAEPAYLPENPEAGWSDWTSPVDIPTQVDMQFVGGARNGANFKVWKFEKGKTNQYASMFTVEPGDVIGRVDKDSKVDYTTGWTVVDVRPVGNDTKVWIVNDSGRVEVRSMKADAVNQKFKKLENDAAGPKPDQQPVSASGG